MSAYIEINGSESIILSHYTIMSHRLIYDLSVHSLDGQIENLRYLILNGKIPSSTKGSGNEVEVLNEEVRCVKKLLKWSVQSTRNKDCYRELYLITRNENMTVVEEIYFKEAFVSEYEESFDDTVGIGLFSITIKEKAVVIEHSSKSLENVNSKSENEDKLRKFNLNSLVFGGSSIPNYIKSGGKLSPEENAKLLKKDPRNKIIEVVTEIETEKGNTGKFVNFSDSSYYGGDQEWYKQISTPLALENKIFEYTEILSSNNKNRTGCGPVAGTNILVYYYQQNYGNIGNKLITYLPSMPLSNYVNNSNNNNIINKSNYNPISKGEFVFFMNLLYEKYILQTLTILGPQRNTTNGLKKLREQDIEYILSTGVWFMSSLTKGVKNYASTKGVRLNDFNLNNKNSTFEEACEFIKKGLEKNCPVVLEALLNEYANSINGMADKHYVIITRMTEKRIVSVDESATMNTIKSPKDIKNLKYVDLGLEDFSVTISTWGQRNEIPSFKSLWESKNMLSKVLETAALSYFTI